MLPDIYIRLTPAVFIFLEPLNLFPFHYSNFLKGVVFFSPAF